MTESVEGPDEFKMSLMEHLAELRKRLFRVSLSVLALGALSLAFARSLYGLLMRPVLAALPPEAPALVFTSAIEEINVFMKVGLYAGIFLTTPVILWEAWSFIAPGLYDEEKKLAGPFVVWGSAAFVAGAAFCYFVVLPSMFQFLLREEGSVALEQRLDLGRMREADALRYLSLGDGARAGELAKAATAVLEEGGDGQAKAEGGWAQTIAPKPRLEARERIEGLGRLVDATRLGFGDGSLPVLTAVLELKQQAAFALSKGDVGDALTFAESAAQRLASVAPAHASAFAQVWALEKDLARGKSDYAEANWTRPMLSMSEQLSLVLVLLLAFGFIFELPLVMAVLGRLGLVKSDFLFKYQRHALVVCLIAAAIITPTGDAVNLALMAGPMLACYEIGVFLVWLGERSRKIQPGAGAT